MDSDQQTDTANHNVRVFHKRCSAELSLKNSQTLAVTCPRSSLTNDRARNLPCSLTIDRCFDAACYLNKTTYNGQFCPPRTAPVVPPPEERGTTDIPGDYPDGEPVSSGLKSLTSRLSADFGCLPDDFSPLPTAESKKRRRRHTKAYEDRRCSENEFCYLYDAHR